MLKYIKPYRGYDALTIFFMVGEVLIDLYQPHMMEIIVNEGVLGLHHGGVPDLSRVMETGGMILVVFLSFIPVGPEWSAEERLLFLSDPGAGSSVCPIARRR